MGKRVSDEELADPGQVAPIRVGPGFRVEFPGCDPAAAEIAANLVRLSSAFLEEVDRRRRGIANLSASGFEALAVLDGADEPLTASVIAARLLVTSASSTSLIDTLARRGYVVRLPHAGDRRKVLVQITDAGRVVVDRVLPVVHAAATDAFEAVPPAQRDTVLEACTRARTRLVELAAQDVPTPGPRVRP